MLIDFGFEIFPKCKNFRVRLKPLLLFQTLFKYSQVNVLDPSINSLLNSVIFLVRYLIISLLDLSINSQDFYKLNSTFTSEYVLMTYSHMINFRQGIGWQLLKASEELISQMSSVKEVYLHCRMIDSAPFNMYSKAGYNVFKTDGFLILLTLQRRKHLMRKQLPPDSDTNTLYTDDKNLASSTTVS